jgi:hypothetical protein
MYMHVYGNGEDLRSGHVDGQRLALVWRGRRIDYASFRQLVDLKLAELTSFSLPSGRPVAVEADKSPGTMALIQALRQAEVPVLILPRGLGSEIRPKVAARAGSVIELVDGAAGIERRVLPVDDCAVPEAARHAAFILTTSGSTRHHPRMIGSGDRVPSENEVSRKLQTSAA